jgi:uncharacterized protein (DUF934 family)
MSRDELRTAGAGKAIIALAPWLTERAIREARARAEADLAVAHDADARVVCLQAPELAADRRAPL